jgi:hypothetical protein
VATLLEQHDLYNDGDLIKKVSAALVVWAQGIIDQVTPDAAELAFAASVMSNPSSEAHRVIKYVIAANKDQDVAVIVAAADTAIQNNVNVAAAALAGA